MFLDDGGSMLIMLWYHVVYPMYILKGLTALVWYNDMSTCKPSLASPKTILCFCMSQTSWQMDERQNIALSTWYEWHIVIDLYGDMFQSYICGKGVTPNLVVILPHNSIVQRLKVNGVWKRHILIKINTVCTKQNFLPLRWTCYWKEHVYVKVNSIRLWHHD